MQNLQGTKTSSNYLLCAKGMLLKMNPRKYKIQELAWPPTALQSYDIPSKPVPACTMPSKSRYTFKHLFIRPDRSWFGAGIDYTTASYF